jgi:hypothetical protein
LLQIEKETKERRQNRANLREQLRISILQEFIINSIVKPSPMNEWNPKIPILDVRQHKRISEHAFYTFGGLIGEIIMTLTSVNDYILALPNHFNGLTFLEVEHFLTVLMAPESNFPKESIRIELTHDPQYIENDDGEMDQVNFSVEDLT